MTINANTISIIVDRLAAAIKEVEAAEAQVAKFEGNWMSVSQDMGSGRQTAKDRAQMAGAEKRLSMANSLMLKYQTMLEDAYGKWEPTGLLERNLAKKAAALLGL